MPRNKAQTVNQRNRQKAKIGLLENLVAEEKQKRVKAESSLNKLTVEYVQFREVMQQEYDKVANYFIFLNNDKFSLKYFFNKK